MTAIEEGIRIEKKEEARYWRVSDQFDDHKIIIADAYTVDDRGNLIFTNDNDYAWTNHHMVNKHYWRAVTECDKDGKPLWSRNVPEIETKIEADFTNADVEALKSYIGSVTESAIRKAMED